jgi:glycine oxidase
LTTDFSASGFLCPSFGDDSVSSWKPPTQGGYQQWLSKKELLAFEPLLNEQVVGGWWFPEDCHINNKKLYDSLKAACKRVGVQFIHSFVDNMVSSNNRVTKLFLSTGQVISADRIVVATGCWLRKLIPLPVYPQKGQMISLCNENGVVSLQRVIYGDGVYIVPRKSGEIVLGATVEDNCAVDFRTSAGGIYKVLEQSLKLVPFLSQLPMKATWTGYRPTTPDLLPIFGKLWYDNVSVCTGHHRNGILLAPISGKIASRIALDMKLNDIMEQADIVNAFSVERFSLGNMRDRSTMEDKSRRKMMIENEVGKEPWNQHVALHHKDSENLSITSSSYNNNNNNHNIKEEKETTQVKLWQVGDDGNLIPIYYRQTPESLLNSEGYGDFEEQIPPGSFGVASTRNNENRNGVVGSSSSSGNKSNTLGKDSSTNEWSRNTDAYLDISTGVDDDNYERELRKAILSNLQFQGTSTKETKPSSMEKSSMEDKKEKSLETKDNDEYREWFKFYENADTSQNIPC